MLEEIIINLQTEKETNTNANSKSLLRNSMLAPSQDGSYIKNKSLSFFFNTVDAEKISRFLFEIILIFILFYKGNLGKNLSPIEKEQGSVSE